ncbi:MAG: hypothetical protein HWQ35_06745 [Nostoc sp. NMS1]|uniref:hypothetical protein n=1 Tax=unclassified Nostoc TaxID=2593658 RepID=UPI0025DF43DD|nr:MULTISPECIES: hypothetical protein [unclassified Nostoc]MBN3906255.1 hypothetical protein [Nostoc sp. NMS1]MBN3994004.1 hypothetical protein [Nostoc sp. NMS2]
MVTQILPVLLPKVEYFARFVVVVFPVFRTLRTLATLKYGQTTLLTSRAIHHNTSFQVSVSLLAVQGKI